MILIDDLVPYSPRMRANFITYEAIEAHEEQLALLREAHEKAKMLAKEMTLPPGIVQRDRMPIPKQS